MGAPGGEAVQRFGQFFALMANTQQPLTIGQNVQYNTGVASTNRTQPDLDEQGTGVIKQIFNQQGETFYQVVWNPGSNKPKVALYRASELSPVSVKQSGPNQ